MSGSFGRILGPIFTKEAVEMSRRPRYYISRAFYGIVILIALFAALDNAAYRPRTINTMANIGQSLFAATSAVQYLAVFLFVPLFLAGVIAGEREEKTLDLV